MNTPGRNNSNRCQTGEAFNGDMNCVFGHPGVGNQQIRHATMRYLGSKKTYPKMILHTIISMSKARVSPSHIISDRLGCEDEL